MAIKKAKANYDNGAGLDTLHYETQANQVKILDGNGAIKSSLEEMLLSGKLISGVSVNTLKDTGLYQIRDCTDTPITLTAGTLYLMSVESSGLITKQTFFDRTNNNMHIRPIYNSTVGSWMAIGKTTADSLSAINASIGTIGSLTTSVKSNLVGAINELKSRGDSNQTSIVELQSGLLATQSELEAHKHDGSYLKTTGGNLTGKTSINNNLSFAGKNTSGVDVNLVKVDSNNNSVIGDASVSAVISAKNADVKVSNGTNSYSVFHKGNMGHGSGFDADTLDGLEGSVFARRDSVNLFTLDQYIDNGKSLIIRASEGSSQAGSLYFKDSNDVIKGKVGVSTSGDLKFTAGTIQGHTIQSSGELHSDYKHIIDATSRENRVSFQRSSDAGIGLFMTTTGGFGMYDWDKAKSVFSVDRDSAVVKFSNAIEVQGRRVYFQTTTPSGASSGDVWFKI